MVTNGEREIIFFCCVSIPLPALASTKNVAAVVKRLANPAHAPLLVPILVKAVPHKA